MNRSGLTIIESMIAMVILGIITVSISQFYQYTIGVNEREEQKSTASAMVKDYLELVKQSELLPQKEYNLEPYRIVNGDTLYYHIRKELQKSDELDEGVLSIVLQEDTIVRVKTILLKEFTREF